MATDLSSQDADHPLGSPAETSTTIDTETVIEASAPVGLKSCLASCSFPSGDLSSGAPMDVAADPQVAASTKTRKAVTWAEAPYETREYEIDEGNNFTKLPSLAKLKAQAARWYNPFSTIGKKKFKLADPLMDRANIKALHEKGLEAEENEKNEAEDKEDEASQEKEATEANQHLSDDEKERLFFEACQKAYQFLARSGQILKIPNMVKSLKATGLHDYIVAKHGGLVKYFLTPRCKQLFGITPDHYIIMLGHNDSLRKHIAAALAAAPKHVMKLTDLETAVKAKMTESTLARAIIHYPNFLTFVEANRRFFGVSTKKDYVSLKGVPPKEQKPESHQKRQKSG